MFSNIDFKENVELTHWQKAYWYLECWLILTATLQ